MPIAFFASAKYSRGFTRTRAPVGQFSWQEYALVLAPLGLSGVFAHRLHFTASNSDVAVTGGGTVGIARLSQLLIVPIALGDGGWARFRGAIEMALYGH